MSVKADAEIDGLSKVERSAQKTDPPRKNCPRIFRGAADGLGLGASCWMGKLSAQTGVGLDITVEMEPASSSRRVGSSLPRASARI